jgi:hypothetical protein
MKEKRRMADIKFEIKKTIGTLSESAKGWTKELNLVSWNGREPKYDIREWDPEHERSVATRQSRCDRQGGPTNNLLRKLG